MKSRLFIYALCTALLTGPVMSAQNPEQQREKGEKAVQERNPQHRKALTPEEKATHISDQMRKELGINDKQYKKVYKLFLKDEKALAEQAGERPAPQGMQGEGRPQRGPEFRGHEGGAGEFRGPQGGRPGGGDGGPEMGRGPQRPEFNSSSDVFSEEYIDKREKKLKKILKEDLYNKWRKRHPIEMPPLPGPFQMSDEQ